MWEWSHTHEAYAAAEAIIRAKPREWLEVVYAEWCASVGRGSPDDFNQRQYDVALKRAKTIDAEALADYIWERTSKHRTCENGGFMAHCCPFGCGCHMVPFDVANDTPAQEE